MLAIFMAQRVVIGKLDFVDMPEVLKPEAYEYLKDSGVEFLAGDYKPE